MRAREEQVKRHDLYCENAKSYSMNNGPRGEERRHPLRGHHDDPAVNWWSKQSRRLGNKRRGESFLSIYQFWGAVSTAQNKGLKQWLKGSRP